jgi:hypothetical protein
MHSETKLQLTLHNRLDSWFSYSLLNTTKSQKNGISASFTVLVKDYWCLLTLKWCSSLTCASAICKWSFLSEQPSYTVIHVTHTHIKTTIEYLVTRMNTYHINNRNNELQIMKTVTTYPVKSDELTLKVKYNFSFLSPTAETWRT